MRWIKDRLKQCEVCGSPVPECYVLCFVCESDRRGRRIKKLDGRIEKLEAGLKMIIEDWYDECGNAPFFKCSESDYPMEAHGHWYIPCIAKEALRESDEK